MNNRTFQIEQLTLHNILDWFNKELSENRNDTIHDLLAYLAEQMIEINKAKNEEIKGFLKWLEREIGVAVDELANKTASKEYHLHSFDSLLEVLKKNKKKISIDPSDRKKQELLEQHFTKSMTALVPVKAKINATDELIDEVVYRLYGLTKEEIGIVKIGFCRKMMRSAGLALYGRCEATEDVFL